MTIWGRLRFPHARGDGPRLLLFVRLLSGFRQRRGRNGRIARRFFDQVCENGDVDFHERFALSGDSSSGIRLSILQPDADEPYLA